MQTRSQDTAGRPRWYISGWSYIHWLPTLVVIPDPGVPRWWGGYGWGGYSYGSNGASAQWSETVVDLRLICTLTTIAPVACLIAKLCRRPSKARGFEVLASAQPQVAENAVIH